MIAYLMDFISAFGVNVVFQTYDKTTSNVEISKGRSLHIWLLLELLFAYSLHKSTLKQNQNFSIDLLRKETRTSMSTTEDEWAEFVDTVQDWCETTLFPQFYQLQNLNYDLINLCFQNAMTKGEIYANILSLLLTIQLNTASNNSSKMIDNQSLSNITTNNSLSSLFSLHTTHLLQQFISSKTDGIFFSFSNSVDKCHKTIWICISYSNC